jgi:NADPH:quinone reductase-like Zn-dependent oxidoreductase
MAMASSKTSHHAKHIVGTLLLSKLSLQRCIRSLILIIRTKPIVGTLRSSYKMHSSCAFPIFRMPPSFCKQQQFIQSCCHLSTREHSNYMGSRIHASPTDGSSESLHAFKQLEQTPLSFKRLIARRTGTSLSDVAEIEEVPMLAPKEGEVLVKVAYAGINGGCETFRARGEHAFAGNRSAEFFTLGAEGAGTIVSIGSGVRNLHSGQHVTFIGGAFSEYVVAKAALCWPVPSPTPEAVALTISGTVANAALKYVGKMKSGDTVLVTAAAGATGSFAVQLAQAAGCQVIATCGSERKTERLRALGLKRVINYMVEDVLHVLEKENYSGTIDIAYEGVGGGLQAAAWNALRRPGGRLLPVGYISEYPHNPENIRHEKEREQQSGSGSASTLLPPSAELFWSGKFFEAADGRVAHGKVWPKERSDTLKAKQEVFEMYSSGKIEAWVDQERRFLGVAEVPAAVDYMLGGQAIGKVVVQFCG